MKGRVRNVLVVEAYDNYFTHHLNKEGIILLRYPKCPFNYYNNLVVMKSH